MDETTLHFLVSQAPTAALALVFLWLFGTGKLHSHAELTRALSELDLEKAAHEKTREALALANVRADTGIQAAKMFASAVEGARHVPEAPEEKGPHERRGVPRRRGS